MRISGLCLTLAAALSLSACGATRYTHVIPVSPTQEAPSAYRYVASIGGPMLMEVYAPPPSASAADIAAAFPPPAEYSPVTYTTVLPAGARKELADYRVVLVFSAPVAFDGDDACALTAGVPGAVAKAPEKGSADLLAAFCRGDRNLRQVRVTGDSLSFPGGAGAEPAQAVLSQVSRYLVPRCGGDAPRTGFMGGC